MRLDENHCEGECYTHGKWAVKAERVNRDWGSEEVPDECPLCLAESRIAAIADAGETAHGDAYNNGYKDGEADATDTAKKWCAANHTHAEE